MDSKTTKQFVSNLSQSLQTLCNNYLEFEYGIQVIGHLYLNIDMDTTVDYVVNEEICKVNGDDMTSVTSTSNSFHAHPSPSSLHSNEQTSQSEASQNEEITEQSTPLNKPEQTSQSKPLQSEDTYKSYNPVSENVNDNCFDNDDLNVSLQFTIEENECGIGSKILNVEDPKPQNNSVAIAKQETFSDEDCLIVEEDIEPQDIELSLKEGKNVAMFFLKFQYIKITFRFYK